MGQKRSLKITTYVELHYYILEIMKIIEEVYELGIMKGSAKKFHIVPDDCSDDEISTNDVDDPPLVEISSDSDVQVCPENNV